MESFSNKFKQKFKEFKGEAKDFFKDKKKRMNRQDQFQPDLDDPMQGSPNSAVLSIQYKQNGNQSLMQGLEQEAIQWYTKSLNENPTNPIVFCNRAIAYKKIKRFQLMYDDSTSAIEYDDTYYKAYLRNGEACLELAKNNKIMNLDLIDKGLRRFQKAISIIEKIKPSDPNYSKRKEFRTQVEKQVLRGKKIKWYKEMLIQRQQNELILIKMTEIANQMGNQFSDKEDIIQEFQNIMEKQAKSYNKQMEVPQYLICPVTDDLMEEPVVLQSGFTYEKCNIQKHFEVNGNFDPMTREEIDPSKLIVNQSIKQATEEFLRLNPWGFEFCPYDTIHSINM